MKKGYDYLIENANLLPSEIAEVVLDFKYTLGFRTLVSKYKLHLDQAEVLEDLTFRVMFNEISPSEFTAKLVSDLNQAPVTAKELTDDTNENIIMPVKNAIAERIHAMLEEYKDIDDSEITIEGDETKTFHPKSAYNEEIIDDFSKPDPKHLYSHIGTLTSADILEGIENPHSSLPGNLNRAVRSASGSKSYSDVMAATNPTLYRGGELHKVAPEPVKMPEMKAIPVVQSATPDVLKNLPSVAINMDPISMKSSAIVVSSPVKIDTAPEIKTGFIHNDITPAPTTVDPYKETF